jgi:hypothetical protein
MSEPYAAKRLLLDNEKERESFMRIRIVQKNVEI